MPVIPQELNVKAFTSTQLVNLQVTGDLEVDGTLTPAITATPAAFTVGTDLIVTDDATIGDDLAVTGLATIGETLGVTGLLTATAGVKLPVVLISGDGAITIAPGNVFLSKGSAAAITLAAPTVTTHDGYVITVTSITAQAHVITSAVEGFNDKGASGTATFGGAKGDSVSFVAYQGNWYTLSLVNVTIA